MNKTLTTQEAPQMSLATREEPSIALMLQTMVEKGITGDSVAAFGQLVALKERMDAKQAEREFATDFIALQKDIPKVKATKAVPGKGDTIKYHFAPYEEIMDAVQPLLEKHGFAVTFGSRFEGTPPRMVATCTLVHRGGHSKANEFGARVGDGPPGASPAQADGAASTYAKRFALCNALNIRTEGLDDDARLIGGPVSAEQASELRERLLATKGDEGKFLAFAGAAHFEAIPATKWDALCSVLAERERKQHAAKGDLL